MEINKLTILTPTYNRGYILEQLFSSLTRQSNSNFSWIIIDDGSTDDTRKIVKSWMELDLNFEIQYFYKKNGGKHKAINFGVPKISTEYVYIVDSDDYLTDDAVERVYGWVETISDDLSFAGVSGMRAFPNGKIIGGGLNNKAFIDASNLERKKYNLLGDKSEIYKTEILIKYPFPEFEGENFLAEGVIWDKIALDGYKIRWFNEIICICEYLEDGLTNTNAIDRKLKNFQGYIQTEKMNLNCQSFPYNYLAVGRFIEVSKRKGDSYSNIKNNLEISYWVYIFGLISVNLKKVKDNIKRR